MRWRFLPLETSFAAIIVAIGGVVALTAILSPPNSADAMAYHLPRVVYWAQSGSVAFFPTPYLNQIMLQPLAEYFMLHTYVLTGGDRLINLIAFAAYAGSIAGVSAIAAAFGLNTRSQAWAALFCATLPNAILQASGAKNDFLLAFWLVCAVYFAARREALWLALSAALALATKGTAYLFLPPLLVYAAAVLPRRQLVWIAAAICVLNGPQYARNLQLSGSPLGFDSAQGDGVFRWRNEHLTWKPAVSNALRHTSEQLGARSAGWNQSVYDAVVRIHRALGLDPQDRDTTWPGARYAPPLNANHEANANNRWHLLLIAAAALFALATRNRQWTLYAAALAGGVPAVLPVPEMAALPGAPGAAAVRAGRAAGRVPGGETPLPGSGRVARALPGEQRAARAFPKLDASAQGPEQPLRRPRATTTISPTWASGTTAPPIWNRWTARRAPAAPRSAWTSARINWSIPSRPCCASAIQKSASCIPA